MAKNVFRAQEIKNTFRKVYIQPPEEFAPQLAPQEVAEVEEYAGPTADDLRREAEEFQARWEQEKDAMLQRAREEADRIVKDAERVAFQEVKSKQDEAQTIRDQAEAEGKRIVAEAQDNANEITRAAERNADDAREEARRMGFEEGREKGFVEGEAEHERLVQRLHVIINKAIDRRNEIIEESEAQIPNLVVQIFHFRCVLCQGLACSRAINHMRTGGTPSQSRTCGALQGRLICPRPISYILTRG